MTSDAISVQRSIPRPPNTLPMNLRTSVDRAKRLAIGLANRGTSAAQASPEALVAVTATTYDGILLDQGGAVYNVKSSAFGAQGNDTHDDTSAIQAAINAAYAAGGGVVYLPPGRYKISGTLALTPGTSGTGVQLVGAGNGISYLVTDNATSDMVTIGVTSSSSTSTIVPRGCAIRRLTFTASSSSLRTAGAAIKVWAANGCLIEDVDVDSQFNGIVVQAGNAGSTFPYVVGLHIVRGNHGPYSQPNSIGLWINGNTYTGDIYIDGLVMNGLAAAGAGIRITGTGAVWITNCDILGFNYGLLLDPGSTELQAPIGTNYVDFLFVMNCGFDTNTTHGIYCNPQTPGIVRGSVFTGCWTSNNGKGTGSGVRVDGNAVNLTLGLEFVGHRAIGNGDGAFIGTSGRDVQFDAAMITGNVHSGIIFGAPIVGLAVRNSRIGEFMGYGKNEYGIYVTSGCYTFIIVGNNFLGNTTNYITGSGTNPGQFGLNLF